MSSAFFDISWADDLFDELLASRAAVYRRDPSSTNNYGLTNYTFERLVADVPCFVQTLQGEELNTPPAPASQTSTGIQQFKIFMRPLEVDDPATALGIRHYLQILTAKQVADGDTYPDPNDPIGGRVLYNITAVSDPAQRGHHIEVFATVLTP